MLSPLDLAADVVRPIFAQWVETDGSYAAHCPPCLISLHLQTTAVELVALAERCGSNLLHLSVGFLNSFRWLDADLSAVAEHCPNLTQLELEWVRGVTASSLVYLVTSLTRLQELILQHLNDVVTDAVLSAITQLPELQTLSLVGSTGYTVKGVPALNKIFHRLRCLGVQGATCKASAKLLSMCQKRCPGLKVLQDRFSCDSLQRLDDWRL